MVSDPLEDIDEMVTEELGKITDRVRRKIERGEVAKFKPATMEDLKSHLVLVLQERIKLYENQGQVAAKWGTTQANISQLLNGKTGSMSIRFILRLAFEEGIIGNVEVRV